MAALVGVRVPRRRFTFLGFPQIGQKTESVVRELRANGRLTVMFSSSAPDSADTGELLSDSGMIE